MQKTILICTDNSVSDEIFEAVKRNLIKEAGNIPIVCVSHEPVDLGTNIFIGKQKRSWLTLYKQLLIGLKKIQTKYVYITEHDCLYSREHFEFTPPSDKKFYYNENVWFVQWGGSHPELNGMYSRYWSPKDWPKRLALSQLVCNTRLYRKVMEERVKLLDEDIKNIDHAGEPGITKLREYAKSGRPMFLKQFMKTLEHEKYETFKTKIPNLDIKHGANFTGPKRGVNRCYELPYWGKFKEIIYDKS
jgi:hypothetical protein